MRLCSVILFLVVTLLTIALVSIESKMTNKCTQFDDREIFSKCDLDYRYMALWCDLTNFTRLRKPEEIKAQAPCRRASYLYFNNSCLQELDASILQKYVSLREINFSDNFITSVNPLIFSKTPSKRHLKKVDLSLNKIESVHEEAFAQLQKLLKLDLSANNLSSLPDKIFRRLHRLEAVILDGNRLNRISVCWFANHSKLQLLSAQNNNIQEWIEPVPHQFNHMRVVKGSNNRIATLGRSNFAHMRGLEEAYFGGNNLHHLDEDTFVSSPALTTLDLSNNILQSLSKNIFLKNCNLRVLKLNGNSLASIHVNWLTNSMGNQIQASFPPPSLKNNRWNCCSCQGETYWTLLQDLKSSNSKSTQSLSKAYDIECSAPDIFHGSYLMSLNREQLRNCCNGTEEGLNDAPSGEPRTSPSFDGSSLDVSKASSIYNRIPSECFAVMAARTTTTTTTTQSTTTKTTTAVMTSRIIIHRNETTVSLSRHNDEEWLTAVLIFLIVLSVVLTIIILYRCRSLLQELKKNKGEEEVNLSKNKATDYFA